MTDSDSLGSIRAGIMTQIVVHVDKDDCDKTTPAKTCHTEAGGRHNGLHIRFDDINVFVPNGNDSKKQVVHGIHGEARPGEILAIMGPTGSGKTTLLTAIAHTAEVSVDVLGRVSYSGKKWSKALKRSFLLFVFLGLCS